MESVAVDIMIEILQHMSIRQAYRLKVSSWRMVAVVGAAHQNSTDHEDLIGMSVRNLPLLLRDFTSLRKEPILSGLMTGKLFDRYLQHYTPATFVISSSTCSQHLHRRLLRSQPAGLHLILTIDEKNLMSLAKSDPEIHTTHFTLIAKDKITIEVCLHLLTMSHQHVTHLKLQGAINDMESVFRLLPTALRSLEIVTETGVHDVRSLPLFLELRLDYLRLHQCYEVCANPYCRVHDAISAHVHKARGYPIELAMSPLPMQAVTYCIDAGVRVDVNNSFFFPSEREAVIAAVASSH